MTQLKFNYDKHLRLETPYQQSIELKEKTLLSSVEVEDFFSFNKKQKKESWWKKNIFNKIITPKFSANSFSIQILAFPLYYFLLSQVPYSNIIGYCLALVFAIKSGIALDNYVKHQNLVPKHIEKENMKNFISWFLISTIILFISFLF